MPEEYKTLEEYEKAVAEAILAKFSASEQKHAGLTVESIAKDLDFNRNLEGEYFPALYPAIQETICDYWENDRPVAEAVDGLYPPYREQVNGSLSVM